MLSVSGPICKMGLLVTGRSGQREDEEVAQLQPEVPPHLCLRGTAPH